jgi:hypothetical protein
VVDLDIFGWHGFVCIHVMRFLRGHGKRTNVYLWHEFV